VPFPDEAENVLRVVAYRPQWAGEFTRLAEELAHLLGGLVGSIDHVGSTSVPGLAAKDVIDVQVRLPVLDEALLTSRLVPAGYRQRPEAWNRQEISAGERCAKLVFAPAVGARAANIHIRPLGGANTRWALLFRDYLRADDDVRASWGAFKTELAATTTDLQRYGQVKQPAMAVLLAGAERWAADQAWAPSSVGDRALAAPLP